MLLCCLFPGGGGELFSHLKETKVGLTAMTRFQVAWNYSSSYIWKEMQCRNNLRQSIDYSMYERKVRMSWRKQHGCMVMNFEVRFNYTVCVFNLRHYLLLWYDFVLSMANIVKSEVDSDTQPWVTWERNSMSILSPNYGLASQEAILKYQLSVSSSRYSDLNGLGCHQGIGLFWSIIGDSNVQPLMKAMWSMDLSNTSLPPLTSFSCKG